MKYVISPEKCPNLFNLLNTHLLCNDPIIIHNDDADCDENLSAIIAAANDELMNCPAE